MVTSASDVDEGLRQAELDRLRIVDTPTEPEFDDLARLAATVCGAPIALISLLDRDRQWFKAHIGLPTTRETPRAYAFCEYAIQTPSRVMIVHDAQRDDRFVANPLVTSAPNIRFYAGAPLISGGRAIGTLCAIDREPKQLDGWQIDTLQFLAGQVMARLEERRDALEAAG